MLYSAVSDALGGLSTAFGHVGPGWANRLWGPRRPGHGLRPWL